MTRALAALAHQQTVLDTAGALTARVYVDCRLTPESFPLRVEQGAVILLFVRQQLTACWRLDEHQFRILHQL